MEIIELLIDSKKRENLLIKKILIEYRNIKNNNDKELFYKLFSKLNIKKID